jgi:hypothetical protein
MKKPAPKKTADPENARDSACRLKMGTTTLTAEATGQKRNINGFDTEHHEIKWVVVFRDNAARKSVSTVSIDLWMAPETKVPNEAIALEKRFARVREKITGADKQSDPILPHEVDTVINTFLSSSVSPADRSTFLAGMGKFDGVKGTPILVQVKWDLSGTACAMDEMMKDLGEKSVFLFMSELKSHKMVALHDSLFVPPKGYKITK